MSRAGGRATASSCPSARAKGRASGAGAATTTSATRPLRPGAAPVAAHGRTAPCRSSVRALRKRGRHLQIGLTAAAEQGEVAVPIALLVMKEASIIGSLGMPAPRFGAMLQMIETGRLAPGKLVHRRIPLEEAGAVLESMDRFGTVGVTVTDRY